MNQWRWNVMQNSIRRGSMLLPIQVQSQLYHFKSRILALVAAQVFRVVMVSQLFGISRKTLYKYRQQAAPGSLASWDCTPRVHGSAKPQRIIEAVLQAKAHSPSFGKQRLANVLDHQGIALSPNTIQRILRKHAPPVPAVPYPVWPKYPNALLFHRLRLF